MIGDDWCCIVYNFVSTFFNVVLLKHLNIFTDAITIVYWSVSYEDKCIIYEYISDYHKPYLQRGTKRSSSVWDKKETRIVPSKNKVVNN